MCRDFIISSVYLAGADVPDNKLPHLSPRELLGLGAQLVRAHSRGEVVDLWRLYRALHRELIGPSLTPIARGVVLARALHELDRSARATLATRLVYELTDAQLLALSRSRLLALARAQRCETSSQRLAMLLGRSSPVRAWC